MRRSRSRRERALRPFDTLETRLVPATITVAPISVREPAASAAVFTATLDAASTTATTLRYATVSGTALAGRDFVATRSSVTIPAGSTSATFSVALRNVDYYRPTEAFSVALSTTAGNGLSARRATATIGTTVAPPTITAVDASVVEGASGTTTVATVPITLSTPSVKATRVSYSTVSDTATATGGGRDYVARRGVVTIAPGATTADVRFVVRGDSTAESDEVFDVALSGAVNGTVDAVAPDGSFGRVVIRDDDSAVTRPTITVAGASATEGAAEVFDVSLSSASAAPVTFRYATSTAYAALGVFGGFTPVDNVLTIPAGQTTATISIPTSAALGLAAPATFQLALSGAANGTLANVSATATINPTSGTTLPVSNLPTLSVQSVSGTAGASAASTLEIPVALSASSTSTVTVHYTTQDNTATAGTDYTATSGTLTFTPGETTRDVAVPIAAESAFAPPKDFYLVLSDASNANLGTVTGIGTILSPVAAPTVSVTSPTVAKPAAGSTATADFVVGLSAASGVPTTLNYATVGTATAVAGADFAAASGSVTFAAGETSKTIPVTVIGGDAASAAKKFALLVTPQVAADVTLPAGYAVGVGTITSATQTLVGISASSPTITDDGASSTAQSLTFAVSLSEAATSAVTVAYATVAGTAVAGTNYTATSGTLTFPAGTTTEAVSVPILGNTSAGTTKTFTLGLASPSSNATITGVGTGSIVNDQASTTTPTLSIAGASVTEPTSGTSTLSFAVTLSKASASAVTVAYATADGTALAGTDYTKTSGTLTIAAGSTTGTISVPIIGGVTDAAAKTFTVTLSGPTNATIAAASATGTINPSSTASGTATVLTNNLSQASGGVETATGSTILADSFTTGSSAVSLTAVTLDLIESTAGSATVAVYTDGGTLRPTTLVGTLTSPSAYSTSALADATFTSSGISLAAKTKYWVVLVAGGGGAFGWSWSTTNTSSIPPSSSDSDWAESADSGSTYQVYDTYLLQMSVAGTTA